MLKRMLCPALLFVCSLVLFLCTLAPTVTFVDSGELIVAARNLGVAHPPGFPLYLLIAHLATRVPIGNIAQRVHFVSALSAAMTVTLVFLATTEAVLSLRNRAAKQIPGKNRPVPTPFRISDKFVFMPGLVAGALAAFSRTLWSYATVAEVYTLNALLILLVFYLVFRWRNLNSMSDGLLYIAAFVFGLALGVHHVTVALTLPALAWLVYATKGRGFFKSRQFLAVALACVAGCAIYAYLPIAASRAPVLNWGNPNTLERFWIHVTGRQYQSNLSLAFDQIQRQVSSFLSLLFLEFSWPWFPAVLVLSGIGFAFLYRNIRPVAVFLFLIIGFNLLFSMSYEIAEDKDAYGLPVFLAIAMAAGFGAYAVLASAKPRRRIFAAIVVLLVPVLAFASNVRRNNRSNYYVAEDYVANIFSSIAPNGLLLTADWQAASPMLYFQEISRQRPDVICIDVLLLRRSWYYNHLESKYPDLMRRAHDSVRLFVEDLLRWEKDPDAYQRDMQLNRRIDERFCSMISTLVEKHLATGPVYSTVDVVLNSDGENQTVSKALLEKYQIVPQGLVFRLFPDRALHPVVLPKLQMRGLIDRSPVVDEDPVIREKILPVYATMLANCGRAFTIQGDSAHAREAYRQAWTVDSEFLIKRNLLPPGISF
jgi:hypothetical protein